MFVCLEISYLFFAYDTVIFCDNDCEQNINLWCIFVWFEAISRLRVNLSKSSVLLVGEVKNAYVIIGNFLWVIKNGIKRHQEDLAHV